MPVTESLLDAGTGTTSASISPAANTLVEIEVLTQAFSGNLAPTVTAAGNGMAGGYTEVANVLNGASGTISTRTTRFRGMSASPSSGSVVFSTSGSSLKNLIYSIKSVPGTDTSGTNGSGAYVQTVTNSTDGSGAPNTLTLTLAAYADAVNNAGSVAFANDQGDAATPDTGYTEVSDTQIAGEIGLQAQYKTPGTTSIVSTAYTAFANIGGIASELKAATSGTTDTAFQDVATAVAIFSADSTVDSAESITATALTTFNGASFADAAASLASLAVATFEGAATADSNWTETAVGVATFEGASTATSDTDASLQAVSLAQFNGQSIIDASVSLTATGSLIFVSPAATTTEITGGRVRKRRDDRIRRDDDDLLRLISEALPELLRRTSVRRRTIH